MEIIEKAIADGYYVAETITSVADIQQGNEAFLRTGNHAQSADAFIAVYDLQTGKDVLLDPQNKNKFVIVLKKASSKQIEIVTSDSQSVERAKQQLKYQNEPVGTLITAHCTANGTSPNPEEILHLDILLPKLDGLWGWRFKQIDQGRFEVELRIKSIEEKDATENLVKLQQLLNYISLARKIGLQVRRYAVSRIPRFGPFHGIWGPEEWMVNPLSQKELDDIHSFISSPEVLEIAEGLNQVYLLTSMPSRLSILWALTEKIFVDAAQHLLSEGEVDTLLGVASNIATLKESPRLEKLRCTLKNKDQFSLKGRNERISENIAKKLGWNFDEVFPEIKAASDVRGKFLHRLKADDEKVGASEKYLRTMLESYLLKKIKNLS